MNTQQQKQFIFKDIKTTNGTYSFTMVADNEKEAKEKLRKDLEEVVKLLE